MFPATNQNLLTRLATACPDASCFIQCIKRCNSPALACKPKCHGAYEGCYWPKLSKEAQGTQIQIKEASENVLNELMDV